MRSAALVAGALAVQAIALPRPAIAQDDFMWDLDPGPDTHRRVDLESLSEGGKPYTEAARLDPLGNALGRDVVPGAWLSWSGLQIHPACAHHGRKLGWENEDTNARIGRVVRLSLQKLLSCRKRYPEVDPYVRGAISAIRRMAVTCSASLPDFAFAGHLGMASDLNHIESWEGSGLGNYLLWDSPTLLHQPIIAVGTTLMRHLLQPGEIDPLVVHTFVHETLHAAGADNRDDHNTLQRASTTNADGCGSPRNFDDRVVLVASLCTGMDQFELERVEQRVRDRIRRCGCGWCTTTFTSSVGFGHAFYTPSDPLSDRSADRLCGRIFDRGGPEGGSAEGAPSCRTSRANLRAAELAAKAVAVFEKATARNSCPVDVISGL